MVGTPEAESVDDRPGRCMVCEQDECVAPMESPNDPEHLLIRAIQVLEWVRDRSLVRRPAPREALEEVSTIVEALSEWTATAEEEALPEGEPASGLPDRPWTMADGTPPPPIVVKPEPEPQRWWLRRRILGRSRK